jgi:hypothetical protein
MKKPRRSFAISLSTLVYIQFLDGFENGWIRFAHFIEPRGTAVVQIEFINTAAERTRRIRRIITRVSQFLSMAFPHLRDAFYFPPECVTHGMSSLDLALLFSAIDP